MHRTEKDFTSPDLRLIRRADVRPEILTAAHTLEARFAHTFDMFLCLSVETLSRLHSPHDPPDLDRRVLIGSRRNPAIIPAFAVLTDVANAIAPDAPARRRYLATLLQLYRMLPRSPQCADGSTLTVAPQREGALLAGELGWLSGHAYLPHAKRIGFGDGLLIGLDEIAPLTTYSTCRIIDGAIASGATTIALLASLADFVRHFEVYSVHAACEGLWAILRFASLRELSVDITVAHVTQGLNRHFYAVAATDPHSLQVGDLGDTIADLLPEREP